MLFDGHVEVVTKYHGGVLHTIGGDSGPNLSVNAHEYADPLADQGVAGFVDNGVGMPKAPGAPAHARANGGHARQAPIGPGGPAAAAAPRPPVAPLAPGRLRPPPRRAGGAPRAARPGGAPPRLAR